MLSKGTKYKLYQYLKAVSECENIVEEQRQILCKVPSFEPYTAFKRLEKLGMANKKVYGTNTISAEMICRFLRQNQVDYLNEPDFYNLFKEYDKDNDGNLDFDDFLQFFLPYDDVQLRAKVSQREPYNCDQMETSVEFEMSRLFEKEIHYHIKVEEEKRMLERQADFNTVACFTIMDPKNFGFIDFDSLLTFMSKYNSEIDAKKINAILRRFNDNTEFKITYRQFSIKLTPSLQGFNPQGCVTPIQDLMLPTDPESDDIIVKSKFTHLLRADGVTFNLDMKKDVLRKIEEAKKTQLNGGQGGKMKKNQVTVRNFKAIYETNKLKLLKDEFTQLPLKVRIKQEDQYLVNLLDVTPVKEKEPISANYEESMVVNRIACGDAREQKENLNEEFGQMWQDLLWGGVPQPFQMRREAAGNRPLKSVKFSQGSFQGQSKAHLDYNKLSIDDLSIGSQDLKKNQNQGGRTSQGQFHQATQKINFQGGHQNIKSASQITNPVNLPPQQNDLDLERSGRKSHQQFAEEPSLLSSGPGQPFYRSPTVGELAHKTVTGSKKSSFISKSSDSYVSTIPEQMVILQERLFQIREETANCNDGTILFFFHQTAQIEYVLETAKQILVELSKDFNTIDAYRLIDSQGRGAVSFEELSNFLVNSCEYNFDTDDFLRKLSLFMLRYDRKKREQLKYSEFCAAFAPISLNHQRTLVVRQPTNTHLQKDYQGLFSLQTKRIYELLWVMHFEAEEIYEIARRKLLQNPNFDVNSIFRQINIQDKEYITQEDLEVFLQNQQIEFNEQDILLVYQKLSYRSFNSETELNRPDTVSYPQFIEEVTPKLQ